MQLVRHERAARKMQPVAPEGWEELAKTHELLPVEVSLLMSCKVIAIDEG